MKSNKFLSFFLILFLLILNNLVLGEEIIFEATEIEAFEKGNILKANSGKALINNNTKVIAEKFEYNKKTEVLDAKGNVEIVDSLNNIIIKSDKIIYFKTDEKFFSEGKTKITIEDKYTINSKDVFLLLNENKIYSDQFTTVQDNEENYYEAEKFRYLIEKKLFRGNKVALRTNNEEEYLFEDVFVNIETNELHGKDLEVNFKKDTFGNIENEPRLKGNSIQSANNVSKISKGAFTTCKRRPDEKCPPWIVEANEVTHDKEKKTIYYKNAWLKIYDVPVLYYPFFFHPDPTVKRQSGLLTPQIGDSQTLGSSAYIPYFHVISDRSDLTFKPRIFMDNKFTFQTEFRKASKKTSHIFDLSFTKGHDSSDYDKDDSRSHFFSNSMIKLDIDFFDISDVEIQLQQTSNNTYLKLFNLESPLFGNDGSSSVSTLDSFINFVAAKEDLDFEAKLRAYEKLDSSEDDKFEYILPSYSLNKNIDTDDFLNGTLTFNSSGSQRLYNTNVNEKQIINDLLYTSEDKFLTNGIKNNYNILFKNVNTDGKNSAKYENKFQKELLSTFVFESSYPLLREGINFDNFLTPKISFRYSPNSMRNLKDEDRRIDIKNIFSIDRIGFSDSVETGQSLTIGADYKKSRKEEDDLPKEFFELGLATVFRDKVVENMPASSSLGNKSSDLVGHISITPNNIFSTSYNFSMDNNLDKFKYNDIAASITVNNFITSFKYIEERDDIGDENYIENTTSYKFDDNNSISFSTRKNKKIELTEYYDLVYQYKNDCLTAGVKYNKEYYEDSDLKPTEQLFFSLTIVPLGAYETKNIIPK
tara:strand:- start:3554 stop:5995 length:2442 start_codon:yes stop_codon:yes gene_type:complete